MRRSTSVRKDDFFGTPTDCTEALLQNISCFDYEKTWEPCCGKGAISKVLKKYGSTVESTDLVGRGFGQARIDFLMERDLRAPSIITNPPFKLADQFIVHALRNLNAPFLALFLKSTYFHAERRRELFYKHQPSLILAMAWRPDFIGGGAGTMDCCWFVWKRGNDSSTKYRVIGRTE